MAAYLYPERKSQPGSAERNAQPLADAVVPLLEELAQYKPRPLHVLEIGSGEGVQLAALAQACGSLAHYQPSEADESSVQEVDRKCQDLSNVAACRRLQIDNKTDWAALCQGTPSSEGQTTATAPFDAVLVFNVIHIVPRDTVEALFAHLDPAKGVLAPQHSRVIFYGAFNENGGFTSEGNAKFQEYLCAKDARFGLRDLQHELVPLAKKHHLALLQRIEMPAGNLLVVFGSEG